ncbi:rhodanese-like domain-containing protein [Anaerovorax odorimutans]|uniref:Rhodanese-like domain-containing protein n=1 Tax=Anaerovorax odorimutans TaxID=109327 RepID=A0ABT1RPP3_9FIRM|nr:rhodanese-like domain-containing protein [Anaerovorax odorimutans]MCQ4637162.1 rhodanese-like domain-containing protein [Anaerovorax odorimutans]
MKKSLIVLVLTVCLLLAACGSGGTSMSGDSGNTEDMASSAANMDAYHKITAEQAKKMMDEGGVTVVDVRTEQEYKSGHIPGSILVPNEEIGTEQPKELPDQDAVLLVHCRTGIRSKEASDKLVKMGYKNVYDFGGIVDWPYETVEEK